MRGAVGGGQGIWRNLVGVNGQERALALVQARTALNRVTIGTIVIASAVLLFTSAKTYFRADDFSDLVETKYDTAENPVHILTKPAYSGVYRPTTELFFLVGYRVSGLNPWSYVASDIGIFALNVYIFFLLVKSCSGDVLQAEGAVLVLLLQVNTYLYTVNWIGAIDNSLLSLFVMASLLYYIKAVKSVPVDGGCYLLAVLCFALGLLTKELAIVIPMILLGYDLLFILLRASDRGRTAAAMIIRYAPFAAIGGVYLVVRNLAGAASLTGEDNYTLSFGINSVRSALFYGMQLGFLPGSMLLFSAAYIRLSSRRVSVEDLSILTLGLLITAIAIAPLLALSWTSPTWLLLPSVGTSMATSVLLRRVLDNWEVKWARIAFFGLLGSALVGAGLLSVRLGEARWLQWGTYTKNVLREVESYYPELPHGAEIYFIDGDIGKEYGVDRLFRNHPTSALRLWFNDLSLEAHTVGSWNELDPVLENGQVDRRTIFVFEYSDGHIVDRTTVARE